MGPERMITPLDSKRTAAGWGEVLPAAAGSSSGVDVRDWAEALVVRGRDEGVAPAPPPWWVLIDRAPNGQIPVGTPGTSHGRREAPVSEWPAIRTRDAGTTLTSAGH